MFSMSMTSRDFYPRPPGGGRPFVVTIMGVDVVHFYPRPPGGGRQSYAKIHAMSLGISIHALRVEGDPAVNIWFIGIDISIHALRVEGDAIDKTLAEIAEISIHALRVEGDQGQ